MNRNAVTTLACLALTGACGGDGDAAHWALVTTLGAGPLRDDMLRQLDVELRQKMVDGLANARFALMYASVAAHDPTSRNALRAEGIALLDAFGGSRTFPDEPRRTYALPRAEVLAALLAWREGGECAP